MSFDVLKIHSDLVMCFSLSGRSGMLILSLREVRLMPLLLG